MPPIPDAVAGTEGEEKPKWEPVTRDEWLKRKKPPGYDAAIAIGRRSDKLMLSIVGRTYPKESDPVYDTKEQLVAIRALCDRVERERELVPTVRRRQ